MDREAWHAAVHGQRVRHTWATDLNWTESRVCRSPNQDFSLLSDQTPAWLEMLKRSWWGIEDAMRTIKCYCKKSLGTWGRWPSEGVDRIKSFKVKYAKTVVQLLSHVWLFATPWTAPHQASLSFTISWSLLKLMSIESVILSKYLILCCPLILLPSIFPSIQAFSNELAPLIRQPNYWNFSFSISSSNEYSGLISFRIDWLDLLAVQGTLKSLLQHHNLKASILQHSSFLMESMKISWLP